MLHRYVSIVVLGACAVLSTCASKMEGGYGLGIQAERQAALDQAERTDATPDTPGMYLALIDRMQAQGLYFASLSHIDAYEQQYGVSPDTILLRTDALRQTGQMEASVEAYSRLLETLLASPGGAASACSQARAVISRARRNVSRKPSGARRPTPRCCPISAMRVCVWAMSRARVLLMKAA